VLAVAGLCMLNAKRNAQPCLDGARGRARRRPG
jgi:hypothetical protein